MQALRITLLTFIFATLGACGGGGGSSNFSATLTASQYVNGDWTFTETVIYYSVYDAGTMSWTGRSLETGPGTVTLNGNGVRGTTMIKSLDDGVNPSFQTNGDTLDGFTVGETLTITGHVDGTTVGLIMTAASGMTVRLVGAPYDGEVSEGAGGKFDYSGYWDGIGEVSVPGSRSGSDCYVSGPTLDGPASSNPPAVAVPLGSGASDYLPGNYVGTGTTYMTYDDGGYGYESVTYDLDITIAGNTVTGTLTLTALEDLPDLEGYGVTDVLQVNGTIVGDVIYVECTVPGNPGFSWRHIWGGNDLENWNPQEGPGMFTMIQTSYGVTYRTPGTLGGENDIDLTRQ